MVFERFVSFFTSLPRKSQSTSPLETPGSRKFEFRASLKSTGFSVDSRLSSFFSSSTWLLAGAIVGDGGAGGLLFLSFVEGRTLVLPSFSVRRALPLTIKDGSSGETAGRKREGRMRSSSAAYRVDWADCWSVDGDGAF